MEEHRYRMHSKAADGMGPFAIGLEYRKSMTFTSHIRNEVAYELLVDAHMQLDKLVTFEFKTATLAKANGLVRALNVSSPQQG